MVLISSKKRTSDSSKRSFVGLNEVFNATGIKQQGLVDTNPGGLNGHMRKHYTLYN